jgi:hypothetical protein
MYKRVMHMLSSFSKLSLAMALFGAGCVAEVQARPAHATYAGYDSYPHTVYHGRTVYYFDGGWHYRHGRRWVHVHEAPDLYHYRTRSRHARNAPDAYPRRRVHEHSYREKEHSHREKEHRRSAPAAD